MYMYVAKTGKNKIFIITQIREKTVFFKKLFRASSRFFIEVSHAVSPFLRGNKKALPRGKTVINRFRPNMMDIQTGRFNNLADISCRLKNCLI
ncbi:MAG: hypothetical protein PUG24_00065 [Eubacteriales bacterium]|nr:hypothetical protein [Eubacteriales bacterium]